MAASTDNPLIFYNGECHTTGYWKPEELFAAYNKLENFHKYLDDHLDDLIMNAYENDQAVLNYIIDLSKQYSVSWADILEFAFGREYPYIYNFKKLPNLPLIYYILKFHRNQISPRKIYSIFNAYIEHTHGCSSCDFEAKLDNPDADSEIILLESTGKCGHYHSKDFSQMCDDKIKESESHLKYKFYQYIVEFSYGNDVAVLKCIKNFEDSDKMSEILESAFKRKLFTGDAFSRHPNVLVIQYILDKYKIDILPVTIMHILDIILSDFTKTKHKDGVMIS